MPQTKYSHKAYILDYETIRKTAVWPGHVVDFRYSVKNRKAGSDRRPLVFVLFRDRDKDLFHGINLNYLSEFEVQKLFREVRKIVPLNQSDTSAATLSETTVRFDIDKYSEKIPQLIYDKIIRPKFLAFGKTDCYRTYSMSKMSSMRVVAYKIERDFRDWKGRYSDEENKL